LAQQQWQQITMPALKPSMLPEVPTSSSAAQVSYNCSNQANLEKYIVIFAQLSQTCLIMLDLLSLTKLA
jgi:hypothetical protein